VPDPDWNAVKADPGTSSAPFRLYNIGNHMPVELLYFIELIERNLGRKAEKNFLPMQPGDAEVNYADVDDLMWDTDFKPDTPIEDGVARFVSWYREYYKV